MSADGEPGGVRRKNRFEESPFRDPLLGGPTPDEIPLARYDFPDFVELTALAKHPTSPEPAA